MQFTTEKIPNTKSEYLLIKFNTGLELKILFSAKAGAASIENYKVIWQFLSEHEDDFQFIPMSNVTIIYLPPAIYWKIYKLMPGGKNLIKNYHYVNTQDNTIYKFPDTQMYFDSSFSSVNGGNGIYGIYHKDNLIYIGYTKQGFQTRFNQHRDGFKNKDYRTSKMYINYDLDEIEFRELITEEEIQKLFSTTEPIDKEILQLIEYSLITVLRPVENIKGVSSPYELELSSLYQMVHAQDRVSVVAGIREWLEGSKIRFGDHYIGAEEIFK